MVPARTHRGKGLPEGARRRQTAAAVRDIHIAGRAFAIAGRFQRFPADEIASAITRAGGSVLPLSKGEHAALVAGVDVGDLVQRERERGVAVLSEDRAAGMFQLGFDEARRWRAVEATLARPKDGLRWRRLCELLDLWPDDDTLPAVVDRCRTAAGLWPDHECEAPEHWVQRLRRGEGDARAGVPRRWRLRGDAETLRTVLSDPRVTGSLRDLSLSGVRLRVGDLPGVVAASTRAGLRSFALTASQLKADAARYIAGEPALAGIESLSLDGNPLGDEGLRELSEARHLTSVHVLSLRECGVGPEGVEALADSRWLVRITDLDLSGNPLGVRAGSIIAGSETLASVQRLRLEGCALQNGGLRALARTANLMEVEHLDVSRCGVADDGLAALVDGPIADTLTSLRCESVGDARVGPRGVAALTASERLGLMASLDLSGVHLDDATFAELLTSRRLPKLQALHLEGDAELTAHALELLCDREPVPRLRTLAMPRCDLRRVRKEVWRGARFLDGVEHLTLRRSRLGMTSLRAMLSHAPLVALRSISLRGTAIGDDGVRALLRAPRLALLREVDLTGCGLGAGAADALLSSGRMDHLERVTVSRDELGPEGLPRLFAGQRFPGQVVLAE